jgi:hypothetical protein
VTLRARNQFVVLRVNDGQVNRVLTAIEERTGVRPQIVADRKGRAAR